MEKIAFELQVDGAGAVSATKALKAQLKEATQEAQMLAQKFGNSSKEAISAAKRAAEIKDEIQGVNEAINALHPEDKFNAVTQAVNGIAGGFAAAEGAMALFGAESEDVQKQMLKVQAALALSQGLNQITELKGGFEALSIQVKATTVYQAAYNFVQAGTTVGARLLRLAMLGIPLVLLATGLILLYQNFDKVKKIMTENIDTIIKYTEWVYRFLTPIGLAQTGIEALGKRFVWAQNIIDGTIEVFKKMTSGVTELLESVNILDTAEEDAAQAQAERAEERLSQSDKLVKARQREIEIAKLQGATEDDIRGMEIKLLEDSLDAYLNYVNARKKAGEEITEDEQEELAMRQQAYKVAILEDSNAEKKAAEEKLKAQQEKNRKLAEDRKKAAEEEQRKRLEEQKRNEAELLKATEESLRLQIELEAQIKLEGEQYLESIEAQLEEKRNARLQLTFEGQRILAQKNLEAKLAQIYGDSQAENDLRAALQLEYNERINEINKQQTDSEIAEQQKRQAARDAYSTSLVGGLKTLGSNIEGQNKKSQAVAKAAAIADLSLQTGKGIANAVEIGTSFGTSLGPAGVVGTPIAIAAMIALTLANFAFAAKKIGAPTPSGGAATGSTPSLSSAPANTVTSTQVTNTGAIREEANKPIRAVVVETDLTDTQKRVSSIEERATF